MKKLLSLTVIYIFLNLLMLPAALAEEIIWKVTEVSAIPRQVGISAEYCQQFTPNFYIGSIEKLMQEGVKSRNGLSIKYRSINRHEQHGLYFTEIEILMSRRLEYPPPWFDTMYIHLQQLTANGPADGVWSTHRCKGRLIFQP